MVIARICWPFPDNGSCRYPESRERVRAGVDFCSRSYWWTSLLNSMLSSLYWCWDSPWRSSQGSIVPAKARYYLFMAVSGRVAIHYRCFSPLSEAAWRWCRGRFHLRTGIVPGSGRPLESDLGLSEATVSFQTTMVCRPNISCRESCDR